MLHVQKNLRLFDGDFARARCKNFCNAPAYIASDYMGGPPGPPIMPPMAAAFTTTVTVQSESMAML